jgi:hypothetical protein
MIIHLVEMSMDNHTDEKHINETNPILQSMQLLYDRNH